MALTSVERRRLYVQRHPERVAASKKSYGATERGKTTKRNYNRRYYEEHGEEIRSQARDWCKQNLDRKRQLNHVWRDANREHYNDTQRSWYKTNREQNLLQRRAYDALVAAQRRARKRGAQIGAVTIELLQEKWNYWFGRCWMCGKQAEAWDHVKPLAKGGAHCLANLRPACKPCNSRKRDRWPFRN
jgi:5-methylcytosine-specific restriction endonuclease McrA